MFIGSSDGSEEGNISLSQILKSRIVCRSAENYQTQNSVFSQPLSPVRFISVVTITY